MISSGKTVALLAVIVMSALSVRGQAPAECTQADVGKQFCSNCFQAVECNKAGIVPDPIVSFDCSATRQVCDALAGAVACVDIDSQTDCSCDSGVGCDAFDETMLLVCDDTGPSAVIQCPSEETCFAGKCVDLVALCTAQTEYSYVPAPPECSTAVYCTTAGIPPISEFNCDPGQYFEPDFNVCETAPPVPCGGTCKGYCPDKINCGMFYQCDGSGTVQGHLTCPATIPYFDPAQKTCVGDPSKCSTLTQCAFSAGSTAVLGNSSSTDSGETTGTVTTRPPTCTAENVGKSYPHETDCKKYYSCRMLSSNSYDYVVGTCLGDLVFNPDTGYCDNAINVDGC